MMIIKTILGMFLLFNRLCIIDIYNIISFLKNIVIEGDEMESELKKCLVENHLVEIKKLQDELSLTLKKNVRQYNLKDIHRDHFTEGLITDNIKKHISRDPDYTIIAGKYVFSFLIYHFFRRVCFILICAPDRGIGGGGGEGGYPYVAVCGIEYTLIFAWEMESMKYGYWMNFLVWEGKRMRY